MLFINKVRRIKRENKKRKCRFFFYNMGNGEYCI